jgi:hypothetical protein
LYFMQHKFHATCSSLYPTTQLSHTRHWSCCWTWVGAWLVNHRAIKYQVVERKLKRKNWLETKKTSPKFSKFWHWRVNNFYCWVIIRNRNRPLTIISTILQICSYDFYLKTIKDTILVYNYRSQIFGRCK